MIEQNEMRKKKIFYILFALFIFRVFFLVLCKPFIGIANNGDFERLYKTVGVEYTYFPWAAENYDKAFWSYIVDEFVYSTPQPTGWINIFTVFPFIAVLLSKINCMPLFDIRYMGFVNAVVYVLAIYLIVKCISKLKGAWSYVLLVLALLVFGDPYILQFLNSFYTEIGSLSGMLFVIGFLVYGFISSETLKPIQKIILVFGLSISALFAVLSKQQDILVVVPIVFIVIILLKRLKLGRGFIMKWLVVFGGVVILLLFVNRAGGNITAYNVTAMDLLSYSEKPEVHLKNMGYNEEEIEYISSGIGGNAFTHSEIYNKYSDDFTRINEVKILLREPSILLPMIVDRSRVLFTDDPNLGNYTFESGAAPKQKATNNSFWYNLKNTIYISNFWFYLIVIVLAFVLAMFGRKISKFSAIPRELFWVYGILPISNFARFMTVILGDSSHDDYKHFFMINIEFDIIFIIGCCLGIYLAIKCFKKNSKQKQEI